MKSSVVKLNFIVGSCILRLGLLDGRVIMNIPEVIQEQSNWCWAACSKSILDYYKYLNEQCDIAEYTREVATWHDFGNFHCCTNPNAGCNYWNYNWGTKGSLEDILAHFGNANTSNLGRKLSIDEFSQNINAGKLVGIRWGWRSGGGHFVVGHGISGQLVYFMNPWPGYGYEIADYNWVVEDGNHTWTHSQIHCMVNNPGNITGNQEVCQNELLTYSIEEIPGATEYRWNLPIGWQGNSNSRSIEVVSGNLGGSISVTALNPCAQSIKTILPVTVQTIDITVQQVGNILTANETSAKFQWMDCTTLELLQEQTDRTLEVQKSGPYAVIISKNYCVDTSICYDVELTGTNNPENTSWTIINPGTTTNNKLHLKGENLIPGIYHIDVINIFGQHISNKVYQINQEVFEDDFELKAYQTGMYFLKIHSIRQASILRFVKK